MKYLSRVCFIFYIALPFVVIPIMAFLSNNKFYLAGIAFYFTGVLLTKFKQALLLLLPVFFCVWFWITYGFAKQPFVFFSLLCLLGGALLFKSAMWVERFIKKTLPERREGIDFEWKVQEMKRRVEKFKQNYPSVKITPDVVDKIRNDVFFD